MTTDDHEEREIRAALKKAFPEVESELRRDLWPTLQRRLAVTVIRVPWYDWALAAAVIVSVAIFPRLILWFAYQL